MPKGVAGKRAVITFAPKPASPERLCAGVVTRTDAGEVSFLSSVDARKATQAFGTSGEALAHMARALCESLAAHWREHPSARTWQPPFHGVKLQDVHAFTARNVAEGQAMMLARASSLHTLFENVKAPAASSGSVLLEQVRSALRRDPNARHLAQRLGRSLTVRGDAQPLRVDFIGQNYACNLLQISTSERMVDLSTERAYGKLFELQALRQFVKAPPTQLGLLDEERPHHFELILVADRQNRVQRRALAQIEALADQKEVRAQVQPNAAAAAQRMAHQERQAA